MLVVLTGEEIQNNKQLQRIMVHVFLKKSRWSSTLLEERAMDHCKLGKELDLFMISEYGPGFAFYLLKG